MRLLADSRHDYARAHAFTPPARRHGDAAGLQERPFRFDLLVRFSTLFSIFSLVPALLYVGYGFTHVDTSSWGSHKGYSNCTLIINGTNSEEVCEDLDAQWVW